MGVCRVADYSSSLSLSLSLSALCVSPIIDFSSPEGYLFLSPSLSVSLSVPLSISVSFCHLSLPFQISQISSNMHFLISPPPPSFLFFHCAMCFLLFITRLKPIHPLPPLTIWGCVQREQQFGVLPCCAVSVVSYMQQGGMEMGSYVDVNTYHKHTRARTHTHTRSEA